MLFSIYITPRPVNLLSPNNLVFFQFFNIGYSYFSNGESCDAGATNINDKDPDFITIPGGENVDAPCSTGCSGATCVCNYDRFCGNNFAATEERQEASYKVKCK